MIRYSLPFASEDNVQWRVDVADNKPPVSPAQFNYNFIRTSEVPASISISDNNVINLSADYSIEGGLGINAGDNYSINLMGDTSSEPVATIRLTITKDTVLIYDQIIPSVPGALLVKKGIAQPGSVYAINAISNTSSDIITPVDIDDNEPVPLSVVTIRGVSEQAAMLAYEGTTDDPFSCFIKSTLTVNCYNDGSIDTAELRHAQDKDFTATVYRAGVLYWTGFVVPDGISTPMLSTPYAMSFTAICGLSMLEDIDYVHTNLPGVMDTDPNFCPMNYIRDILFLNLGIVLPIRWTNLLECTAFAGEDVFTGSVGWGVDGQAYVTYSSSGSGITNDDIGPAQKCDYILEGMLEAMQCRIYQSDGRWNIRRIPDAVSRNSVPYKQITGDTGQMTIQSGTEMLTNLIGRSGFPFIAEDALLTTKAGLKSSTVTYNANIRNNLLPNGNQDMQINGDNGPLYWNIYPTFTISSAGSLDGRTGFCSDLINQGSGVQWFELYAGPEYALGTRGLPIDTYDVIPYINFGFLFEIVSGFPMSGGFVDFSTNALQIKLIFNAGGIQYWLNEFGFWVTVDTFIPIMVGNVSIADVVQVNFNAFQNVIMPEPLTKPQAGDTSNLQVMFRVSNGQFYKVDNIYLNYPGGNDVYQSVYPTTTNTTADTRSLNISSSFGGYQLSNFMTSPFNSGDECYFKDEEAYSGTLTGLTANCIMRYMYKAMDIFNGTINTRGQYWSFDEFYNIDSLGSTKFMPINANYNIEKCENVLVAMECRNDLVNLTENYQDSNTTT